jgi:hypothetical protein
MVGVQEHRSFSPIYCNMYILKNIYTYTNMGHSHRKISMLITGVNTIFYCLFSPKISILMSPN